MRMICKVHLFAFVSVLTNPCPHAYNSSVSLSISLSLSCIGCSVSTSSLCFHLLFSSYCFLSFQVKLDSSIEHFPSALLSWLGSLCRMNIPSRSLHTHTHTHSRSSVVYFCYQRAVALCVCVLIGNPLTQFCARVGPAWVPLVLYRIPSISFKH